MSTKTSDDAAALAAWRDRRDQDALRALCERYAGVVHAACVRQGSPDPDEATQAVCILLSERAGSIGDSSRLAGWLMGAARRVVAHQRRGAARRRRHEQEAAVEHERTRSDQAASDPLWDEARAMLDEGLTKLSPARREAIIRFYLQGAAQADIAQELGCSVDAVKTRVHEGLATLRAFLTKRGVPITATALVGGLASQTTACDPAILTHCTQAAITPAVAPTATALAHGVTTAMIIKTTLLSTAALLVVGSCLTTAVILSADTPQPNAAPVVSAPAVNAQDPGDNAALQWWRAFAMMPADAATVASASIHPQFPSTVADAIFLKPPAYLKLFAAGASKPYCDWGIDGSQVNDASRLHSLNHMRTCIRMMAWRVRWHVSRNDFTAAVSDAMVGMKASRLMIGSTSSCEMIDQLVAISCEAIISGAINAIMGQLDDPARRQLLVELQRLPARMSLADTAVSELSLGLARARQYRAMPFADRLASRRDIPGQDHDANADITDAAIDGFLKDGPGELQRWISYLRQPLAKRVEPLAPLSSLSATHPNPLIRHLLPTFALLNKQDIKSLVKYEHMLAALAYLDAGEAGLTAHPNPITGEPFVRQTTDIGFRLVTEIPGESKPIVTEINLRNAASAPSSEESSF